MFSTVARFCNVDSDGDVCPFSIFESMPTEIDAVFARGR